nr:hypothetical protein [Tanacetum cinerariifolium]
MHTRASNSELVEPFPELKRTLNRRLRQRNIRVPFDQTNNPPKHLRIVYLPILNINYFRHFLDILRNSDPMDDEPMWAADRVVNLTPDFAITIPETTNEFVIKGYALNGAKIETLRANGEKTRKSVQASVCARVDRPGNFEDPSLIVYPAAANGAVSNFKIQPNLIAILPVFRGHEEPYAHLREFYSIADTYQVNNTTKDGVRLRIFPFSLKDQAKAWFTSLEPGSIHSWSEMQSAFLDEFYSISKTSAVRNRIKSFRQIPGEQF